MFEPIGRFLAPRETISVTGGAERLIDALAAWGVTSGSVVIVCDRIVDELGHTRPYLDALAANGFSAEVFNEITGEPTVEMVDSAISWARNLKADMVIGVGGGSALDTAKLVAYSVAAGTSVEELRGEMPSVPGYPPLVLIPTTTGTGSEATRVAMYSSGDLKVAVVCNQFVPLIALLDAAMVEHLPNAVVAATSLDALSHSIEAMLSTNRNHLTKTLGTTAARTVLRALPLAFHSGSTQARGELLYASYLGGLSLNAAVVVGHSLSYAIASRQHLSHGAGCALALPFCLAYNHGVDAALGQEIASRLLGEPSATLRELAHVVKTLTASVGLPTNLSETGMPVEAEPEVAAEIISAFPRPNNPVPLTETALITLLGHLRSGDIDGAFASDYSAAARR